MKLATSPSTTTYQRAFSLIEAAIVLGVVGLVIGGIWVGASVVNENIKITQAVNGMGILVDEYRQKFSGFHQSDFGTGDIPINAQFFSQAPDGYTITGNRLYDPWGNEVYKSTYTQNGWSDVQVQFAFYEQSHSRCMQMMVRTSKLPNFKFSYNNSQTASANTTLALADTRCVSSETQYVFSVFAK